MLAGLDAQRPQLLAHQVQRVLEVHVEHLQRLHLLQRERVDAAARLHADLAHEGGLAVALPAGQPEAVARLDPAGHEVVVGDLRRVQEVVQLGGHFLVEAGAAADLPEPVDRELLNPDRVGARLAGRLRQPHPHVGEPAGPRIAEYQVRVVAGGRHGRTRSTRVCRRGAPPTSASWPPRWSRSATVTGSTGSPSAARSARQRRWSGTRAGRSLRPGGPTARSPARRRTAASRRGGTLRLRRCGRARGRAGRSCLLLRLPAAQRRPMAAADAGAGVGGDRRGATAAATFGV